jgi:hypothetical protein
MRKSIIIIAMALGLSFAGVGIADATSTADSQQCTQARTALVKLQAKAETASSEIKAVLSGIVANLTTQVNRVCGTPNPNPGGGVGPYS